MTETAIFAGFRRRTAAFVIDTVLLALLWFLASKIIPIPPISPEANYAQGFAFALLTGLCLSSRWQATPGMRLMKASLVRAGDYAPPGAVRALARSVLFYAIPLLCCFLLVYGQPHISQDDLPSFTESDIARYKDIRQRQAEGKPISIEEDKFVMDTDQTLDDSHEKRMKNQLHEAIAVLVFSLVAMLAVPAPILFTAEKKSLCDMICKTRVLYGRA